MSSSCWLVSEEYGLQGRSLSPANLGGGWNGIDGPIAQQLMVQSCGGHCLGEGCIASWIDEGLGRRMGACFV